jgi:hypothetical protein
MQIKSRKMRWVGHWYSRDQRFWHLKCVNWNLGTFHLPEVRWKGGRERGREGANSIASSFHLRSFSGPHAGLCHLSQLSKRFEAAVCMVEDKSAERFSGKARRKEAARKTEA